MAQLIRNYQDGSQIVLSDQLRRRMAEGVGAPVDSPELTLAFTKQMEAMAAESATTLAKAKQEAAALLRKAETDVMVLQAEAQARGFDEGYQQGIAEGTALGQQMIQNGIEAVQAMLVSVQNERTHLLLQAEHEAATLALAIAEKIVAKIGQEQRDMIVHTVNRALNELTITGPFLLRVHPDDAAYFNQTWEGVDSNGEAYVWKLVPDAKIEPGGCILTCGSSTVDARLSTQLKSIVNGLSLTDYCLDSELEDPQMDEAQNEMSKA